MVVGEILKAFLYFFLAFTAPLFLAKGIFGLLEKKGCYTFKIIWSNIAYIYGFFILTLFFIKLIYGI